MCSGKYYKVNVSCSRHGSKEKYGVWHFCNFDQISLINIESSLGVVIGFIHSAEHEGVGFTV